MFITVFTPTYNRASLLPRLYESLCRQTFTDFEWLIVDDGSADDTGDVVKGFIAEKKIAVRYIKKVNGGKHTAINKGVKEAGGELFLILDSDDSLPVDSLKTVRACFEQIKEDDSFAGVCGYMAHHDGTVIGTNLGRETIDASSIDLRYKYDVRGDMCEVFRTAVLKEYPFPEIAGERFCPEALVWNRIAGKYKLHVFNKVIYFRDYLDGGLTSKMTEIRMKSPVASMMCYSELNKYNVPFTQKVKAAINYWRFSFCAPKDKKNTVMISALWLIVKPLGWLMHAKDLRR